MPISIKIEDHYEQVIEEFFDRKGILTNILNFCYENPSTVKVFKYVDLYDDTVFNSLQVKDFVKDINFLKQHHFKDDVEREKIFVELIRLSEVALKEPHLYLKFYGD